MSYMHIDNLYKNQDVLMFKECYASEKIHGTSAHIKFEATQLALEVEEGKNLHDESFYEIIFFSGGAKYDDFVALFDQESLGKAFVELGCMDVVVYGEAYGGKMQGMSKTYGKDLKFVVFEVKIGNSWLSMPKAEEISKSLGLDFVPYERIPTTLEAIDAERDRESIQAIKNGMGHGHKREGIVLRPIEEAIKNNGKRIICKHKAEEFIETRTPRKIINPEELTKLRDAENIAGEWVTEMRLTHVLQNFPVDVNIESTGDVIKSMLEDIKREAEGEIIWNKEAQKAISKHTAIMFKRRIKQKLENP